jgi:transcriptional regulator with XRE-family HTH domain
VNNELISHIIKDLCKSKEVSIKQVLEECQINKGFIYDLEKKNKIPSIDKIIKIADYFNVSTDYITGRTKNPVINK